MLKKHSNLINILLSILLFIILCTWFIPNYMKGIDITDTCFSLGKYKFVFSQHSVTGFSTLLTDIIGGLLYNIAPSHQLLVMNMANALCYTIGSLFIIYVLRKDLPLHLLLFTAIVCNFFSLSNMHIFNYNTTTFFFLSFAFGTLLLALRKNNNKLLIFSGFLCGINIFSRLPNALHCIMILGVFWHAVFCNKESIKEGIIKCVQYLAGMFLAFLSGGIVAGFYLGFSTIFTSIMNTINTFTEGSSGASAPSSHSAASIFSRLRYQYTVIWEQWKLVLFVLLIVAFCIWLLTKIPHKAFSSKSIIGSLCVIAGFFCSLFALYQVKELLLTMDYRITYLLWMIILFMSLLISFWGIIYYRRKNAIISTACFVNMILIPIIPVGTDVGCLYYNYFIFIPVCVILLALSHIESKEDSSSRHFTYYMVCAFLLCYTCISGYVFQKSYIYRDKPYKELTSTVNTPVFYGMHTTKERADAIELATTLLEPYSDYEIVTLGDFNVLPLTTDMPCYLKTPWPDLSSFADEEFIKRCDEKLDKGILPVIVLTPKFSIVTDEKSSYRSVNKYNKLVDIIETYNYNTLYKSDKLEIYVPSSTLFFIHQKSTI